MRLMLRIPQNVAQLNEYCTNFSILGGKTIINTNTDLNLNFLIGIPSLIEIFNADEKLKN